MKISEAITEIQMIKDEDELKDALCEIIQYSAPFEDNPLLMIDLFIKNLLNYYREYNALEHTDEEDERKSYTAYLGDQE